MRREDGAATVLAGALCGVIVLVAAAVAGVTALIGTHRVAGAAADLSALGAAAALQDGQDPCGRAAELARRNRARLTGCTVRGWQVAVTVVATSPRLLGRTHELPARARAGPVGDSEP